MIDATMMDFPLTTQMILRRGERLFADSVATRTQLDDATTGHHQHARAGAVRLTENRTVRIGRKFAALLQLVHEDRPHLVLVSGN